MSHHAVSPEFIASCRSALERITAGRIPLDEAEAALTRAAEEDDFVASLSRQGVQLAERAPRQGWALAALAHQLAQQQGAPLRQARAAYALGVTLNRCEHFDEALTTLEQARVLFEKQACALDVVRCDWQRGVALRFVGRPAEAVNLLERTVAALHEAGQEAETARAERDLAIAYNLLERFDDADTLIVAARAFFERASQPVEVALCDLVIGSRLRQLTRYQDALHVLNNAIQVFQSVGRPIEQAKALFMVALIHIACQTYEEALTCLQKAKRLFRSADLSLRIARCNLAQGRVLWRLGKLREARAQMEKARAWFAQSSMLRDVADCLLNLGNVAYVEGNYNLAEAQYKQARCYYDQVGLGAHVALCDRNLGLIHCQRGQFSAALDLLHRAADSLEKQGLHVWVADCHRDLAELYLDLRQPETALLHLERAKGAYHQEGLPLGEALCEVWKAHLASRRGDFVRARQALEQARQVAAATGSARYVALCDRLSGNLLLEQGQVSEARQRYQAARDHFAAAGATADEATCRLGLGRTHVRCGELDRAEAMLQAVLHTTGGSLPELDWQAYAELGHIARSQGHRRRALTYYQSAIEALRTVRLTLPEARLGGGFVASRGLVYDAGVRLALELEDFARALEIAEESRAQVLARTLRSTVWPEAEDPYVDELRSQEAELRAAIQMLRQRLIASSEDHVRPLSKSVKDVAALLTRLRAHLLEHQRVLQQLHTAAGGWLEAIEPFRWERFRTIAGERLPAGWSALIYHWLDGQLVIFHIDNQGVRTWVREPGRVERAALAMCTSPAPERRALIFQGRLYGRALPSPIGLRYRRLLYRLLIPEAIAANLSPDQLLLIVPHGCLHHLPFQALESERGFLAQQAVVGYIPSLGSLERLLLRCGSDCRKQREHNARALLVGIDIFRQPKPPLRWALIEVDRVARIYGVQSDRLRNEEATTEILRSWAESGLLNHYATLHLVSHAYLDAASGALSGIALWDDDLTFVEIGRLRLEPAVVVLSACQSGLGEINPGDEIVSLPYAFLTAGAQTVIASLWHVDDESTADLMAALHFHLHAGRSPAVALARTQRQAIQRGYTPYEWGAFVATGVP
ncbi:MAG TPA: CHAT domain-containing protein [Thermoflexia bacterium]|nr:CHAT domain-containing protein [Thermoflexia bacterium]